MRKRITYANVAATLALVFAMSGGALAARHYLINSTKQISPSVLKKLKGKAGKTGKTGATGAAGKEGTQGKEGTKGGTGPAGPFPGVLPSGLTLRGGYAANVNATEAGQVARVGVSYGFTLASKPTVHFLEAGAPPTAECPGSVSAPAAQAGHLCVYERTGANTAAVEIYDPTLGLPGSSEFGWYVRVTSAAAGDALSYGTWAVTSP